MAFLPLGAYDASSGLDVHMNSEEAIRAFDELGADLMIPIHYLTPDANIRVGGERRGLWIFASMASIGGRFVGWSRPCQDVGQLR